MIIDFHTHSFPDSLAERAMTALKANNSTNSEILPHTDGTADDARRVLAAAGINRAVVCNIATNARQESKVNGYAISLLEKGDFFSPLGSVHPDSENIESELDRLCAAGIKGVKLHPDYVRIPLSDSRFDKVFSILEERGFFAVIHAGYDPVSPDKQHATPDMIRAAVDNHPKLKLVAAHMGGFKRAKEVSEHLVGSNVYIDTSLSSLRENEREELYHILNSHSPERILFGTDTPWSDPEDEIRFINNAPISEEVRKLIFYKNACKLLGIS